MERTLAISFLMMIGSITCNAQKKQFNWLIGTWKLKDKNVFETWTLAADKKSLDGLAYRIKEADTIVNEKVRLTFDGKSYHYVPDVEGPQPEVDFAITSFTHSSFVAENPKHDFPKLIRYNFIRKEGRDNIEAAIEGDGKVIPYIFERIK